MFVFTAFAVNAQVSTSKSPTAAEKNKMEQKRLEEQKRTANQPNEQANNPNAPIIKFDKTIHDYGTIQQHADGNCEFHFTNTGKEPLILSNVRSS